MKKVIFLSFALMIMSSFLCNAQTAKKATTVSTANKVEAYYFHNTARCVTCKTVEAEAKADLENLYGSQVTFKALNLEDDANKAIAKKLEVSGQTLLLVKGDQKINLTNEGFLYAVTNPTKLKSIIKEKVDGLLDL
jgi:thiol-disulfide isomerase/thioredoxin